MKRQGLTKRGIARNVGYKCLKFSDKGAITGVSEFGGQRGLICSVSENLKSSIAEIVDL